MATTGLKRPSDFEANCNGLNASDSPNWPVTNANKRLCLNNNFTAQSQQQNQNMYDSGTSSEGQLLSTTPFKYPLANMNPLCDDVNSMIKYEFHKANSNHYHNNPNSNPNTTTLNNINPTVASNQLNQHHHQHNCDTNYSAGSNSLNQHHHNPCNTTTTNENASTNNQTTQSQTSNSEHDTPVLSIRQTQLICEKVIRERELKLREEYDKILISKLSEQYDTFVKYTHDHIEKRYNESNSHQASYLS